MTTPEPSPTNATPDAPFRIHRILVPVDFSECSVKALRYALPFARQFGAEIAVLYVLQAYYPGGELNHNLDLAYLEKEIADNAARDVRELVEREIGDAVPVRGLVRNGRPADQVCRQAKEDETDLIIVSTHGHTGLKHIMMGSIAELIVRHAPCPVLVVRTNEHDFVRDEAGMTA